MTERDEQDRARPAEADGDTPVEDLDLREQSTGEVQGGRTPPPPSGPVPTPYPN